MGGLSWTGGQSFHLKTLKREGPTILQNPVWHIFYPPKKISPKSFLIKLNNKWAFFYFCCLFLEGDLWAPNLLLLFLVGGGPNALGGGGTFYNYFREHKEGPNKVRG